jgi:hypothetical protein
MNGIKAIRWNNPNELIKVFCSTGILETYVKTPTKITGATIPAQAEILRN